MAEPPGARPRWAARLLREPTLHFFVIGALLFFAHHVVVGEPHTIVVDTALKSELRRRFRDHTGRVPSAAELELALRDWKRDEALYREALRQELDRGDATIRAALVDKMRARTLLELPKRAPTEAELEHWLASHRSVYETPLRYDFESITFPKSQPGEAAELQKVELALASNVKPATLGRPIFGATLSAPALEERFGPKLAEEIRALPPGKWQRLESEQNLLLVRLNRVDGGLPSKEELRARLVADFSFAEREQALARATDIIVDRYQFEEKK
jgi:hypothetical protein